jgi:3-phosphoshikimate 1-carboxyvinyltransferase
VEVEERSDGLLIEGRGRRPFHAARVAADGDHRIAMSAAIAGLAAEGEVRVEDAANVRTSFPTFADLVCQLGGELVWV